MKKLKLTSTNLMIAAILILNSASCANTPTDSLNKDSQKYLSFYETVAGERIHWEVNFDGNEITSIYKDGKKIPGNLVSDYKGKVYRELDEMRFGSKFFSFRMPNIDIDMEDLQDKFKDYEWHWEEFKFDDEKLKKEMEELKEKLKDKKFEKYYYKFDDEKFKERMEKLEKLLEEHFNNFELKFDFEDENKDDEV
ncbi:MAG: hypothetical protein KJN64_12100 [Ignavibacteria bacterium]|nr:hypothetical protein [Ignavibacteria bacterium]MBT8383554.1 hypothetical protein [Ignavibacteria bacterium]MBT8390479.1 hypothetical protein [Ignavibacteria bacterium]NNJ52549.1 hypothetical protein [Ignavibacteriaceae bacterium]NNL20056.1 hypothetical protein [Ignavibacteriaceae bacterium]